MALIRDYELPGTGLVVPNAYHVVTNVKVEKRTADTTSMFVPFIVIAKIEIVTSGTKYCPLAPSSNCLAVEIAM